LRRNLGLAEQLRALAVALHAMPAQAAIASVAEQGADVIPLIGARNRSRLGEALGTIGASIMLLKNASAANP
jgi:aryl-alcohol dehydrogenase-like predicted oxidoreductase